MTASENLKFRGGVYDRNSKSLLLKSKVGHLGRKAEPQQRQLFSQEHHHHPSLPPVLVGEQQSLEKKEMESLQDLNMKD